MTFRQGSPSPSGLSFAVDFETREREENGWEYSAYRITTTYQGQPFCANRRYKEFKLLHSQLRAHVPSLPVEFPLGVNVFNRFAPDVIESRKVGFQHYLQDVLAALQGAEIPPVLRNFLELPPPVDAASEPQQSALMVPSQLEATDTVILVSYQLPLIVSRKEGGGFDAVWDDNAVLNKLALNLACKALWVGCVGLSVPDRDEQDELAELLFERFDCVVVFLEKELHANFYQGFCRGYLRPILHNTSLMPGASDPFCEDEWRACEPSPSDACRLWAHRRPPPAARVRACLPAVWTPGRACLHIARACERGWLRTRVAANEDACAPRACGRGRL